MFDRIWKKFPQSINGGTMLRDMFKSKLPKLTEAELNILNTIDSEITNIDNFSISNIAKITYSSTTSINRLVKKLDMNYSDFKYILYTINHNKISEQIQSPGIYIDNEELKKTIENIKNANTIYIIGVGQSAHISHYFSDILFKLGYNCHLMTDSDLIINVMRKLQADDYVIFISSSGSTKTLVDAARHNKLAKSLVITSSEQCSLSKYTTNILFTTSDFISNENFSFSLQSRLMQIIDIIIVKLITS